MEHPPTPALLVSVTLDEDLVCLHGPFFVILNDGCRGHTTFSNQFEISIFTGLRLIQHWIG